MRIFRLMILLPALLCTTGAIAAPADGNTTIKGTVVDDTGDGLPFATIVVVDSNIHTITDINGNFTIQPTSLNDKLEFRFVGFEPVTISVADAQNNPKIVLTGTNKLAEVTTAGCKNLDEEIDPKTGKCVKIKTAEPAKEPVVEPAVATDPPVPTPKPTPEELEKRLTESQDALDAARDKENSLANKLLTGASTAATGIGAMQAASAIAEQRADRSAERDMRQYITTMQCEYGDGKIINLGNTDVTLPGGNELLEYYSEYKSLADNLKTTKSALGLRSGIESEVLYDRAQSGLYQYATAERGAGGEISLYRALTDKESEDASAWAEQKEKSAKQLTTGGLVAAAGVATGVIGNYLVNERGNKNDTNETDIDEIAARAGSALGRNRNNNKQSNESAPTAKAAAKTTPVAQAQNHSGTEQSDETNPTGKPSDKNVQGPLEQKKSCDEIIKAMQDAACNTKGLEAYDYSGHVKPECLDKIYIACDGLKNLSCSNSSLSPIATTNYGYSIGQSDAREDNNGFWCTFKRDRSNTTPEKSNSYDQSKLTDYQKHVRAQYDKYSIACGPNRTQQIELLAQDDYKSNIYKKLEKECSDAGGDFLTMVEDKKSTGTVIYNCHALECN